MHPPLKRLSPLGGNQVGPGNRLCYIDKGEYTTNGQSPLRKAKDAVSIRDAWATLGLPGVPARDGQAVKSPLRPDRHPSFVLLSNGTRYFDHATADTGDVVDFVAAACGTSKSDAARRVIEWAGGSRSPLPLAGRSSRSGPTPQPRPRQFPKLESPTYADVLAIQRLRKLPESAGLEIAIRRRLLWMGNLFDYDGPERVAGREHRSWVVTDDSRRTLQGRRLDGEQWAGIQSKAKTPAGFGGGEGGAWIIGAANLGDAHNVFLCEGGADLLATITVAWIIRDGRPIDDIGFACITGNNSQLHADALFAFSGRHVRILFHDDTVKTGRETGAVKADGWGRQLRGAGATVDFFNIRGLQQADGRPAKDINEVCWYAGYRDADAYGDTGFLDPELGQLMEFPAGKAVAA